MISETLATGIARYRIGPKVRALRKDKKLGLAQLGEHSGLSPGMLSKIERGQLFPTLPTLMRIALVFGVGLEHFFSASEQRPRMAIARKEDRVRLPDRPGAAAPSYFFESLDYPVTDRRMEAFYAEFPAGSKPTRPHAHAGAELLYVIRGQLTVELGDTRASLREGDATYFEAGTRHSYRQEGTDPCAVIVVVAGGPPEAGAGENIA